MKKIKVTFEVKIDEKDDAEAVVEAIEELMENALNRPGVLDRFNDVGVGMFNIEGSPQ